mgnify:FL=1
MKPIDAAVKFIKALPEQQAFQTSQAEIPIQYQQENRRPYEGRAGTIHPAILGMMERRQMPSRRIDFPDKRMAVEGEKIFDTAGSSGSPSGLAREAIERRRFGGPFVTPNSRYGTIMGQGPMQSMTGERRPGEGESDESYELTDAAQKERGSVFDAGHYNKYGLPMVGVRQLNYPYRPETNPPQRGY